MSKVEPDCYPQFLETPAGILRLMSNSLRLQFLNLVVEDEVSVGSLSAALRMSQSVVAQHLAVRRGAKLVSTRRASQAVFYCCGSSAVKKMLAALRGTDPPI